MQHNLGPEGLAVVAVYILLLLAIGWFSRTKVNNLADFVVAGRSMNRWQIGLSIVATWVSGTTILAFPAMGYTNGLAIYFFGSGASLASGLWAGFYIIPYMRKHELLTVPELLETWFGPRHRVVALLAVWARELAYVGSSLVSIGVSISYVTPLSYTQGVTVGAGVTVLYVLMGGQRAVILTDALQNIIIITLTVAMLVIGLNALGGWHALTSQLAANHKAAASGYPWSNLIAWLVMGLFQALPYQALIQRGLSAKSVKEAQAGFLIGGLLGLFWYVCLPLLGMLAYARYGSGENASDVFLLLASREYPPIVYALLVVVLLGAVMSTLDSVLMSVSSNFVVDIYRRFFNPAASSRTSLLASRVAVLLALVVGIVLAFVFPIMLELLWVGTRIMVAGVGPVIAALFLYRPLRNAPTTILWAMILGMTSTVITFLVTGGSSADVVVLWTFDPIYVGLSVNIMALITGSLLECGRNDGEESLDVESDGMDERARANRVLAIIVILGVILLYYAFWLWALNV